LILNTLFASAAIVNKWHQCKIL